MPVGVTRYQTVFNVPLVQQDGAAGSSGFVQRLSPATVVPKGRGVALQGKSLGEFPTEDVTFKSNVTNAGGLHESTTI